MRLISTNSCKEGMTVAKAIYTDNGTMMLNRGMELKQKYIDKLRDIGINHIYVDDKSFNDLVVADVIKDETRQNAIICVKDVMKSISNGDESRLDGISHIVKDIVEELLEKDDILVSLAEIRSINEYIFGHSVNVGVLSMIAGISLKYSKDELFELGLGATIHDIGKTRVTIDILNKPGRLSAEEFEEIKAHTTRGYEILKNIDYISDKIAMISLYHHERYDGKGYPNGLVGEEIPEWCRIVSVVDVFDALTNNRVYRKRIKRHDAIEYILSMSGKQFDNFITRKLLDNISVFTVGEGVLLSTGEKGYILNVYKDTPTKPLIKVVYNDNEKRLVKPYKLDLRSNSTIKIVETIEIDDEQY